MQRPHFFHRHQTAGDHFVEFCSFFVSHVEGLHLLAQSWQTVGPMKIVDVLFLPGQNRNATPQNL
jgi:hypothetical protein